jgi:hypothetical protein
MNSRIDPENLKIVLHSKFIDSSYHDRKIHI